MPQVDIVTYYSIVLWLGAYFFIFFNFLISKGSLNFFNLLKIISKANIVFYGSMKSKLFAVV